MQNREIKQKAAEAMNASRRPVIVCSCAFLLINFIFAFLIMKLCKEDVFIQDMNRYLTGAIKELPQPPYVPMGAQLIVLIIEIMLCTVGTGFTGTFLKASRGEKFGIINLMDGFEFFFKALGLHIVRGLLVIIGLTVFVVPGILLFYRYSLAVFVLYDNPDEGIIWCLRESARLVNGRKKDLFTLHFSFLPLFILGEFLALIFAPILDIWLRPYFGISCAVFYNGLLPVREETETAPPHDEDGTD